MALVDSFEKSGNWLFRYRGQIPVILFVAAIPVVYFTNTSFLSKASENIITIISISISLLGFIIRAISIGTTPAGTSGRNTREGQVAEALNTKGIYSMVRHPLYLGNYFMWIGIVLFTFNFSFVVIVSLLFWLYYERIMFAEERFLERKFGDTYMNWARKTPSFMPCFRKYVRNEMPLSFKSILKREYSGVLATVIGFVFIDDIRRYFETGQFEPDTSAHWVLGITIILVLILRSLKHYTQVFKEEGRS
ncbi:MAG: isoprenylcysteine carboxylmethyltransferase family protein [Bacteroidetes bacterium]|nr:isoprenylcysteine carboxylmethyltransferase family protein [Bacteroidota bacterium]